jgi:hypothetical protein
LKQAGGEIIRLFNNLERDLRTNEDLCPAKADSTFADRTLVGYMRERYTAFKKWPVPKFWRKRRDEFRKSAAACFPS